LLLSSKKKRLPDLKNCLYFPVELCSSFPSHQKSAESDEVVGLMKIKALDFVMFRVSSGF